MKRWIALLAALVMTLLCAVSLAGPDHQRGRFAGMGLLLPVRR